MARSFDDHYVFLGPSLPLPEAREILPARYCPPASCGDVFKVLRLQPRVIVLIDGNFERSAAVWHKEIMFALSRGVTVVGASSMGALRAAELSSEGMVGIGAIYQQFADGRLEADDEVAVAQLPRPPYTACSEALVNVRATVGAALGVGATDAESAAEMLSHYQRTFYAERHLHGHRLEPMRVDLKRLDAITALSALRDGSIPVARTPPPFAATMYARTLWRRTLCEPFICDREWLPEHERLLLGARLLGPAYPRLKTLATVLAVAHGLKVSAGPSADAASGASQLLPEDANLPADLAACVAQINAKLRSVALSEEAVSREQRRLRLLAGPPLVELGGDERPALPHEARAAHLVSLLWTFVRSSFDQLQVQPSVEALRPYSDRIRSLYRLETSESLSRWCTALGLSKEQYLELVGTAFAFDYLVLRNNNDCISEAAVMDAQFWLQHALRLSGAENAVRRLMSDRAALSARRDGLLALDESAVDGLRAMDFSSFAELEAFVEAAIDATWR